MSELDMQDQFEEWAREKELSLPINRAIGYNRHTQVAWEAWQASRSYFHIVVMKPFLEEIISTGVKKIIFQTELLAAAERYWQFRHDSDVGFGTEYVGVHPETELKNAIAKAKGESHE